MSKHSQRNLVFPSTVPLLTMMELDLVTPCSGLNTAGGHDCPVPGKQAVCFVGPTSLVDDVVDDVVAEGSQ